MSQDRIGVGLVGVTPGRSWAAIAHIPALRTLPAYQIVGIASSSEATAKAAAVALDVARWFGDTSSMARDQAIDLVVITVKVPHHRALVETALSARKMVYCEWPLGNGLAEAQALTEMARAAGVRTVVGLQARSSPVIRYVRDLVRQGFVGDVLSTTLVGSGGLWGAAVNQRNAYTYDRANGATMLSIPFGHTVDALCHCLGEFRELSATSVVRRETYKVTETQEERPMTTDDQIVVGGRLDSGAVVAVHYRGGLSRGTNLRWEINGTRGDLEITAASGHGQMAELALRGGAGAQTAMQALPIPAEYRFTPMALSLPAVNVGEAYAQFAMSANARYPVPDFDDAVARHRLLEAIEASSLTGGRVAL